MKKKQREIFSKFDVCLVQYNVTAAVYWPPYLAGKKPLDMHYNNFIFYNIFKTLEATPDNSFVSLERVRKTTSLPNSR